jgi:transposase
VRHRDRLVQDMGDRVRQLHRILDLGFPEITGLLTDLSGPQATTIVRAFPTAKAFEKTDVASLAAIKYDRGHTVGVELATKLKEAAKRSVGQHHGPAYQLQARHACEDIAVLRARITSLDDDLSATVQKHEIAKLLTTIGGIGDTTASRLVAELGDITRFESADALAAYVGVVPSIRHSGKSTPSSQSISCVGHADLRAKLYMPTLAATRYNPWLRAFYERLCAKGKLPKVALVAAMRKLLHAIYSVAKNRRPFVPAVATAS